MTRKAELQGSGLLSSTPGKYSDFSCFKVTEKSIDECLFGLGIPSEELSPNSVPTMLKCYITNFRKLQPGTPFSVPRSLCGFPSLSRLFKRQGAAYHLILR